MLLYEIKVLLGYLVCSVTNASNAVEFVGMYSKTRKKTMGAHLKNHIYKQVMAIYATFIGTENNSVMKWEMEVGSNRFVHTCY